MISSASTLFLATLVFTTSVFGAPIRVPVASDVVPRAETAPELVARAAIVDVQPFHRRSELGRVSRRSARLPKEQDPHPEIVETPVAREVVEEPQVQRRVYPRRVYYDHYEKREPQPEPVKAPAPVVQKREDTPRVYPRRALYERFEKREPTPEPGVKFKETTISVTKVSTFDSPDDLIAATELQLISGGSDGSGSDGNGSDGSFTETLLSVSQTQTIDPAAAGATLTVITVSGTPIVTAIPTETGFIVAPPAATESVITVTAGSPTDTASLVTVTAAPPTDTASLVTVTASSTDTASLVTITASSTDTASLVTVTASATSTATDSVITSTATPAVSDTTTSLAAVPTVTDTGTSTVVAPPAVTSVADEPPVDISQPNGGTMSFAPVPRDAVRVATTEPIIRRSVHSGAAWASFVRRQST